MYDPLDINEKKYDPLSLNAETAKQYDPLRINEKPVPTEKSFHEELKQSPNTYAAVKTAEDMIPWVKYVDPEERDRFMKLSTNKQVRELLYEDLNLAIGTIALPNIGKAVSNVVGPTMKRFLPKTYEFLTKEIGSKAVKPSLGREPLQEPPSSVPADVSKVPGQVSETTKPVYDPLGIEKPQVEAAKPTEASVPKPTPPDAPTRDFFGKEGVEQGAESKLAIRTEASALEKKLSDDFGHLAEYQKTPDFMKVQAARAEELIKTDYIAAKKMAMGETAPPSDVYATTMYKAVENRALMEGDIDTLYKLGTQSKVATRASELGQEIKAADVKISDSPVDAMKGIAKERADQIEKITGKKPNIVKQAAEIERLKNELDIAKKALEDHPSSIDSMIKPSKIKYGSENRIVTQDRYKQVVLELRKELSGTKLSAGIDPVLIERVGEVGVYHFEAGARSFGTWSKRMIVDLGVWVKPHLKDIWDKSKTQTNKMIVDTISKKISKSVESGKDLPEVSFFVQKLSKHFVEQGVKDRNVLVKEVHNVIKDIIPEITERETMDAISGYGKYKLLSKDEISVKLRDLKGQLQQIAKLEDLQQKQSLLKTGIERRIPSAEENRLIKLVNESKRRNGIVGDGTAQLKSLKTRLTNETAEFTDRLKNLKFDKKEKRATILDSEARDLKAKHDVAKENYKAVAEVASTVTREEAAQLVELSKVATEAKQKFNAETGEWASPKDRIEYGTKKRAFVNYVEDLKSPQKPITKIIKNRFLETKVDWGKNKAKAVTGLSKSTLGTINDAAIAFVASVDDSFMGRQGLSTLMTHPTAWARAAGKSFVDFGKTLASKKGGRAVKDAVMADAYSRPNYMNGNYVKAKLIPRTEEQFPTSLPERIPLGVGRIFKASENAFLNSGIRMRIETFDILEKIARKQGVDTTDKLWVQDVGKLINSVTARGDLGRMGSGGLLRAVMWAPKKLKGDWDVLTAHTGGAGLDTSFARQQARLNLIKIVSSTAAIAAIANAVEPGSVEINPLSSDFLKIKKGNTRFDITAGKGSLVTLLARAITFSSKSNVTGIINDLNSDEFGSKTVFDVGVDFLANKTTPFARTGIDIARGKNFQGEKPTLKNVTYNLTIPISIKNFVNNFYGPDADGSVAAVVGSVLDVVGINANTYTPSEYSRIYSYASAGIKSIKNNEPLPDETREQMIADVKSGKLTEKGLQEIDRQVKDGSYLVTTVKKMKFGRALKKYDEATPEEKKLLYDVIMDKGDRLTKEEQDKYLPLFKKTFNISQ